MPRSPGDSDSQHKPAKRKRNRAVSTLTPAQLERKRANDRETQRAIRARTRDYITYLEQEVEKLKIQEACSKTRDDAATVQQLVQKNKALQEEIARLRQELCSASVTPTTLAFPPQSVEHASVAVASVGGSPLSAFTSNGPDWEDGLVARPGSVPTWGPMHASLSSCSLAPPPPAPSTAAPSNRSGGGGGGVGGGGGGGHGVGGGSSGLGVQQAGPSRQYVSLPTCSNCNRCVSGVQVLQAPVTASLHVGTGPFPPAETVICEDCLHVLHNQGGLGSFNVVRRGI
ncbi:hypothetical protein JDV02_004354 [Purpureocillium takamizusanense]|uniref:BZIP domain-containing protein n=1 Tax=Purpureocillium takamizusanense TaxID=2060973 RepID=A0A9Q8QEJ7_9HYPO|nr:uncharacterized protein JDV02_004354 [Purpureocillium takamizusanense]UNI18058.1 hypothetical protein JDV02_004354 [Purpureocillium takamizusanense]